jgi:hypothetical protein
VTRARSPVSVAVVVVYAALGVAIGMVFWALLIHSDGDSGRNSAQPDETQFQLDQQKNDERQQPREGDGE